MRDHADNVVVICSIENFDPMGVHTGDSITVAPVQTLTDVEYQRMRDAAFACIRRIGVDTGGSNIQFALNPANGEMVVIEMNPRVSRSSALASKATGFPIAKIAARLAVGYRLDEIMNDITGETPASFEPTIDYVVTKMPRWAFEKLPGASPVLGTQMQSVGEVMAIGRTFTESLQKACRSLETGRPGLQRATRPSVSTTPSTPTTSCAAAPSPTPERLFLRRGRAAPGRRHRPAARDDRRSTRGSSTRSRQIVEVARRARRAVPGPDALDRRDWRRAKRLGFGDAQLAYLWGTTADAVRDARLAAGVAVTYKTVDTCAAEFAADTPYHYGTYEDEDEVAPVERATVVILGSGPNRIGQGVEFDYCCVHAAFALSDAGFETVMVNCNPETVSTDYDTSDRLFFEPLIGRGRAQRLRRARRAGATGARPDAARRGDREPRRPDPAQARPRARGGRHPGPRHQPGVDRPRRGPRAASTRCATGSGSRSPRAARPRAPEAARADRRRDRLPGARAPVVRARRPGDADRLRRRRPRRGDGRARRRRGASAARAGSRPSAPR